MVQSSEAFRSPTFTRGTQQDKLQRRNSYIRKPKKHSTTTRFRNSFSTLRNKDTGRVISFDPCVTQAARYRSTAMHYPHFLNMPEAGSVSSGIPRPSSITDFRGRVCCTHSISPISVVTGTTCCSRRTDCGKNIEPNENMKTNTQQR